MKRPDGWDELYLKAYLKEHTGYGSPERAMFEAGADAYRAWLKKGMGCCDYHSTKESHYGIKGCFVFIPEGNECPHKHVDGIVEDYPPEEVE